MRFSPQSQHRACLVSDGIPAASKQLQDFIFVAQHLAWLVVTWTEYLQCLPALLEPACDNSDTAR